MRCVNITSWPAAEISAGGRVLLQLERRHGLGDFQQVGRLAVDGAQRGAHLRQDLLLAHHGRGVLFGALHQRHDLVDVRLQYSAAPAAGAARRRRPSGRAPVAASDVGAFLHVGEGLRRCPPAPATPTWPAAATASATGRYPPPAARPCRPARTAKNGHRSPAPPAARASSVNRMRWCVTMAAAPEQRNRDQLGFAAGVRRRRRILARTTAVGIRPRHRAPRRSPCCHVAGRCSGSSDQRSGMPRLRSPLAPPRLGGLLREQVLEVGRRRTWCGPSGNTGLSADAQELGLLRQRLQVDFLPVRAVGIGVAAAEIAGRAFAAARWRMRRRRCCAGPPGGRSAGRN